MNKPPIPVKYSDDDYLTAKKSEQKENLFENSIWGRLFAEGDDKRPSSRKRNAIGAEDQRNARNSAH